MKQITKLLLATAFMLVCTMTTQASHLMGGDIWVEKDAQGHHILKHKNFRDTLGILAYAETDFRGFKWNTTTSTWDPILVPPTMSLKMPMDSLTSGFLLQGVPYGIEMYNYKSDTLLLDSIFALNGNGRYRFYTDECCRNAAIQNLTVKTSMIIHCEYTYDPIAANQSPRYLAIPVFFGPVNSQWVYNPLPFDPDADSIAWVVDTPVCYANSANSAYTYCGGYTTPSSVSTGPFTLNNTTGQLDWTPNTVGNFVASFKVSEYRGGVEIGNTIRDMQYIVVPDSNSNGPVILPEFIPVTNFATGGNQSSSSNYNYMYYYPGSQFTFTVGAMDQNNGDVLTMSAFGNLFEDNSATFVYAPTGNGNMVNGTITWTPGVNETRDQMIVIRANDGTFSKDFTIILKRFEAPNAVNDIDETAANISIYPNPAKADQLISLKVVTEESLKDLNIRIVDLTGKLVSNQEVTQISSGVSTIELDQRLQAGFYFAQIIDSKENKIQTVKFVVQ